VNEIELATLAGFFAGEGSITLSGGKLPTLYVAVGNTEKVWIDKLHRTFGGVNYVEKPKYAGAKFIFRWRVSGKPAMRFLQAIQPYLIGEKLGQLEAALKFQKIKSEIPNRNAGYTSETCFQLSECRDDLRNLRCTAAETNRKDAATYGEVIVQS
jgi:LAGLIDADG-like domain